ncbi:MAG: SCO family protein [Burkholderiales bacterium]
MPVPRTLLASLVVVAVGGAVLTAATDRLRAFTTETARRVAVRQHPVPIPAVTLQTQSGAPVNFDALRGKWLLVDFIYTRCMTYCAALGGEFARLQHRLAAPVAQGRLQLLSISFDPAHDTPGRLAAYLQRSGSHGAGWLAARPVGSTGLEQLTQAFGITVIPNAFGGYTHNAAVEIVDPQGRLTRILDWGDPARVEQVILQDMNR